MDFILFCFINFTFYLDFLLYMKTCYRILESNQIRLRILYKTHIYVKNVSTKKEQKYNKSRVTRVNAFASMLHDRSRAKDDKCRIKGGRGERKGCFRSKFLRGRETTLRSEPRDEALGRLHQLGAMLIGVVRTIKLIYG